MRITRTAGLLAGLALVSTASPAVAFRPAPGLTLECVAKVENAVTATSIELANGVIRPDGARPAGKGQLTVHLSGGRILQLRADSLVCRRDGGLIPEAGGANIADFSGTGQLIDDSGPRPVDFQAHVEDRGEAPERRVQDFIALRLLEPDPSKEIWEEDELYLDANYLTSGTIKLVPTTRKL
jgi:hypothetical protein